MVLGRIWTHVEFNGWLKMFVLQLEFKDFAFFCIYKRLIEKHENVDFTKGF